MGADELFGGYKRHRTALNFKGWSGLRNELELDLARISTRNLGRDNRIVSDCGCQGRLPYLDESVVSYVSSLQPWERYVCASYFSLLWFKKSRVQYILSKFNYWEERKKRKKLMLCAFICIASNTHMHTPTEFFRQCSHEATFVLCARPLVSSENHIYLIPPPPPPV